MQLEEQRNDYTMIQISKNIYKKSKQKKSKCYITTRSICVGQKRVPQYKNPVYLRRAENKLIYTFVNITVFKTSLFCIQTQPVAHKSKYSRKLWRSTNTLHHTKF